jgi:hypothetical protein
MTSAGDPLIDGYRRFRERRWPDLSRSAVNLTPLPSSDQILRSCGDRLAPGGVCLAP